MTLRDPDRASRKGAMKARRSPTVLVRVQAKVAEGVNTSKDLAAALGVHHDTVCVALMLLYESGAVEREAVPHAQGRGRPFYRYTPTGEWVEPRRRLGIERV